MTGFPRLSSAWAGIAAAAALMLASPVFAQTGREVPQQPASTALSGGTTGAIVRDEGISRQRSTLLQDQRSGYRAPPFGSELFAAQPPQGAGAIIDPDYVMRPGDRVQINQSGLINSTSEVTVDSSGNIIVPGLGPVRIEGVPAGAVDSTVRGAARRVFSENVQVYASPVSATTTQVFVTGAVLRPGAYGGSGSDSVITYLQRAGGPDPDRGSYRHIYVRNKGRILAEIDLYAFLISGELPDIRLHQGDVIVVGEQGPVVSVTGDARAPYTFELAGTSGTGSEVLSVARPRPEVTNVSVLSIRDAKPVNAYLTLPQFTALQLMDGDRVRFEADSRADTYVVRVEGAHEGPSSFAIPKGTSLATVLSQVNFDSNADRGMIHLRRVSAAETQKQLLDESLGRLEKLIYTTPAPTPAIAQSRQVDSAGLQRFIERARTIQPPGLVSLQGIDPAQVLLEPDDAIIIPFRSQAVVVGGEVALPQTIIARGGMSTRDYVKLAGGFTERANKNQVLVIRPDSSAHVGGRVNPGDRVLVPPKFSSGVFELIKDVTTILYQVGVAAAAVLP